MSFQTIHELPLTKIQVTPGRALRHPKFVDALAASIREVGLMNPICVTKENTLIAGLHRLEAAKLLGWKTIPARVLSIKGLHAELAEIDENFARADLTALERVEALKRRKEVYEALHPTTKKGGDHTSEASKAQSSALSSAKSSFAVDTAEKTGVSARSVQADVQIAEKLTPEAKEVLAETPVADSKKQLLEVSREKPKTQKKIAERIKSGAAKTVREAKEQLGPRTIEVVEDEFGTEVPKEMLAGWSATRDAARAIDQHLRAAQIAATKIEADLAELGEKLGRTASGVMIGRFLHELRAVARGSAAGTLQHVASVVRDMAPLAVCTGCEGTTKGESGQFGGCRMCGGTGSLTRKSKAAAKHERARAAGGGA